MRRALGAAGVVLAAAAALLVPGTRGAWTASVQNVDAASTSAWFSCAQATTGLATSSVFRWNLTEAAATSTASDANGTGVGGTYQGTHAVAAVSGPGGCFRETTSVASFDGTSAWVGSAQSSMPSGFSSHLTLAAWVRTPAGWTGAGDLIMLCNAAPPSNTCAQRDFRLYLTGSGGAVFGTADTGSRVQAVQGGAGITDGAWHLVTGTLGTTGMRLYIDGVDVTASSTATLNGSAASAASFTTSRSVTSGYWHVGNGDGATNWPAHDPAGGSAVVYIKGQLTGVTVLNATLSAKEVASLAAAGR